MIPKSPKLKFQNTVWCKFLRRITEFWKCIFRFFNECKFEENFSKFRVSIREIRDIPGIPNFVLFCKFFRYKCFSASILTCSILIRHYQYFKTSLQLGNYENLETFTVKTMLIIYLV